jgi:hypothetical protein
MAFICAGVFFTKERDSLHFKDSTKQNINFIHKGKRIVWIDGVESLKAPICGVTGSRNTTSGFYALKDLVWATSII